MNTNTATSDGEDPDTRQPAELWQQALGEGAGRPWRVMCGSGVTACHHVISGLLAGLPEPRVYVGSWSEWIRDEGRPRGTLEGRESTRTGADLA